jgi:tetratricopeptide (TPR) repeat protein
VEVPPDQNVEDGPLTTESFRSWSSGARPTIEQLAAAASADRRTYGLLAYLMGEPEHASEAWEGFSGRNPMDFLADALIGEYLREQGKYLPAFALLRPALDHFNEANFLYVRLADVAVGMGNTEVGEDLLKQSESKLEYIDPYGTGDRVRADLCALRGQDDQARERYVRIMQSHQGAIVRYHFSQFLELRGRTLEALKVLDGRLDHEFVRLADDWWNTGSEPTWERLRGCLADPDFPLGPFPAFVQRYRAARERVESGKSGKGLKLSPFTQALAERRKAVGKRAPSLLDLAGREDLTRIDLSAWRRLPTIVQCIHAIALCANRKQNVGSSQGK